MGCLYEFKLLIFIGGSLIAVTAFIICAFVTGNWLWLGFAATLFLLVFHYSLREDETTAIMSKLDEIAKLKGGG